MKTTWNAQTAITQIEKCAFECEGGPLTLNVAYQWLKESVAPWYWRSISERLSALEEPRVQFVIVEGSRSHGEQDWSRRGWGIAHPRRIGEAATAHGYKAEDIAAICEASDIDPSTAVVTHWMPAIVPAFPLKNNADVSTGGSAPLTPDTDHV